MKYINILTFLSGFCLTSLGLMAQESSNLENSLLGQEEGFPANAKRIPRCCGGNTVYNMDIPKHREAYERDLKLRNITNCSCVISPFAKDVIYQ